MEHLYIITDYSAEKQVKVRLTPEQVRAIKWLIEEFYLDNMEIKPVASDEVVDLTAVLRGGQSC